MRRCLSFAMILLLLSAAIPAMACSTGRSMNGVESSCCRAMQSMCSNSVQRDCCRLDLRSRNPEIAAQSPVPHFSVMNVGAVLGMAPVAMMPAMQAMTSHIAAEEHSPPVSVSIPQTVLRI